MRPVMPKIKTLRNDIRSKGWCITAFKFFYNEYSYVVIFEDAKILGCSNKYTIAYLTFIDLHNENRTLYVSANTTGFDGATTGEIKEYFRISDTSSTKSFFPYFYSYFNEQMPSEYIPPKDSIIKKWTIIHLGKRNHEPNPEAIYCYDIRRNPVINGKQCRRTIFNSNKARLLRKSLYEHFKDDYTISFYFSPDSNQSLSDAEIIKKFANRNKS